MKAAIISAGSISSKFVAKALKSYIREVDEIRIKDIDVTLSSNSTQILCKGKPMEEYDCLYMRGPFRASPLLRAITTVRLDKSYMPLKPAAFTLGHDKILTHLKLKQFEIPMPKTYLSSNPAAAKKILKDMNYPVIMKFPQGTQGKGVMFAESYAAASSMLDALIALKQPFLIQEYVETEGTDIRALVVGDKVVASMRRKAGLGETRSNIHAGGKGTNCEIDASIKKIAVKAAQAIGADICGVDILESAKGPLVIEVNVSPGLQELTKATKINVADIIAKFLFKSTKEFIESKKEKDKRKDARDVTTERGPAKEIITNVDFRGERILLPEIITKETHFTKDDELIIRFKKGKLAIEKMDVGK